MKLKPVLLGVALLGVVGVASASPSFCSTESLAAYEALGATGCTIGGATVASFLAVSGTTGATPIDPTTVTVTPTGGTTDPELTFSVMLTATSPTQLESIFTYMISGPAFTMDMITLAPGSETSDAGITDIQNYCVGGSFGPDGVTGCTGSASGGLLTLDGIQNTDQTNVAGVPLLSITDDFVLDGGPTAGGSASGGTFSDQFTATSTSTVPEPGVLPLTAAGLALLAFGKLRFRTRNF